MSEQPVLPTTGNTGNTPAGTPETTGTPAATPEPEWLPGRLDRAKESARKELLAELGFDSPDTLKTLVQAEKDRKDAEKTFEQRYKERDQAYKALETNHKAMRDAFNTYLNAELETVPKEHQERLNNLLAKVGDDPLLRLGILQDLKPLFAQPQQQQSPEKRKPEEIDARQGSVIPTGGSQYTPEQKKAIAAKYGQTFKGE